MLRSQRGLAAAMLSAVAFTACGHGGGRPQTAPPVAVDVTKAVRGDIATYLALDGQITPLQQSTLSTPQSGVVTAVYANEGQHVSAGQLLAQLDNSTLRAQLAQQEALASQAQALLGGQTLQANITPSQAQTTVATAKSNLQTAQAALVNAKLVYDGDVTLYKSGYVAQVALEAAHAAYIQAQQNVTSLQAALENAKAQGTNAVPIQDQQVAGARATLKSAQAQVRLLQAEIVQTSLKAPFDGVITQRMLDPGGFASPNQPILQISQIAHVYVNVNVPDSDLGYVQRDTPVSFTSSSLPGRTFSGRVFDVNATPTNGTLSYRARIVMPNPDGALRGGMLVSVSVRTRFQRNAIIVPLTAVVQGATGAAVYTVAPLPAPPGGAPAGGPPAAKPGAPAGGPTFAQAKLVPVKLGLQTDTQAQVTSPEITAGTTIITTRPDSLQDKSTVAYSPGGPAGGAPKGAQSQQADSP